MLVVGASRGLGAAIAGGLASQSATVWAGYAHSVGLVETLRQEFGSAHLRPVRLDALDTTSARSAFETIAAAAGTLDGVVFCAAPPLHDLALHHDAAPIALTYIEQCVAMTLHPLVEALPRVRSGGWLAFVSSSAVADPPAAWPHYVAAKGAIEALAVHCARHSGLRVATVRAPRMWTDMTNGPTGAVGAAAPEAVAAAIVQWVLDDEGKRTVEPEHLEMKGS